LLDFKIGIDGLKVTQRNDLLIWVRRSLIIKQIDGILNLIHHRNIAWGAVLPLVHKVELAIWLLNYLAVVQLHELFLVINRMQKLPRRRLVDRCVVISWRCRILAKANSFKV